MPEDTEQISLTETDKTDNEGPEPIGRTSATEREAITSDKFAFWLPDGVIVNPFDIVAADDLCGNG